MMVEQTFHSSHFFTPQLYTTVSLSLVEVQLQMTGSATTRRGHVYI